MRALLQHQQDFYGHMRLMTEKEAQAAVYSTVEHMTAVEQAGVVHIHFLDRGYTHCCRGYCVSGSAAQRIAVGFAESKVRS